MQSPLLIAAAFLILAASACATAPPETPSGPRSATVTVSDASSSHVVTLRVGDHLLVVLHSIYWAAAPIASSNASVLRTTKPAQVVASPFGCVPGEGCGTVTVEFSAIASGDAAVTASRVTCGEALRCVGEAGSYRLTVSVRPG